MSEFQFDVDFPAPSPFLIELGRMTCLWATLESTVNIAISKLAGYEQILDYRALILIAHSNFQQRVDAVSALCEQLLPTYPHLADYKEVISKAREAQRGRNRFAHNGVTYDAESGNVTVSQASARGKLKTSVEPVVPRDIHRVSETIHEAVCLLHSLVTQHELKPLWERDA